jgi:drug/metabolite transporter (DMT)-like permease
VFTKLETIPYLGEILALLTAMIWAAAVICFKKSGEQVHPIGLNLFKIVLGVIFVFFTMLVMNQMHYAEATLNDYFILIGSGIIGIGISDTLFFKSLNILGAGLSAIVDCLYSPFVIFLCFCWIDERLSVWQIVGAIMILSAVLTAASRKGRANLTRKELLLGILYGVLAMITVASSIVVIKPMLCYVPLMWAIEIRLLGGLVALLAIWAFHPQPKNVLRSLHNGPKWKYTIIGSFLGGYVSVIAWVAGMKFAQASIVAALNQTSNIFIFVLAALFLHEPLNRQRILGIVLAMSGAFLIIFRP